LINLIKLLNLLDLSNLFIYLLNYLKIKKVL